MDNLKKRILQVILIAILLIIGLGLLIALGYGAYILFKAIWATFVSLDNQIKATLISVSGTAIIIVIALVIGKSLDIKREIKQQQRTQKMEFYEEFLKEWFDFLSKLTDQKSRKIPEREVNKFIVETGRKLILRSGKHVIDEYIEFRYPPDLSEDKIGYYYLVQFERLLFEIRKELGYSKKELRQYDLLSLYVTDIETVQSIIDTLPEDY
jgi:hypothetical protein